MEVKIPKQIKILTHTYTVKFDSKELLSSGTCGLCKHLQQEIILEPNHPKSEVNQIFLHEFIHTIERHLCVKLDDADVERLSEGWATLLFDNLGIEFDWSLIEGDK